jgi:hypothetical protein
MTKKTLIRDIKDASWHGEIFENRIAKCAHITVKSSPCALTEHHAMKAYWGAEV